MQVPVAAAQIPVCWSVPGNLEAILAAETQRFVLAASVAGPGQHRPTTIVSPRGAGQRMGTKVRSRG